MNLNSKMPFLLVILLFNRLFLTFFYFFILSTYILGISVYPIRRFNSSVCPLRAFSDTVERHVITQQFIRPFSAFYCPAILLSKFNRLNPKYFFPFARLVITCFSNYCLYNLDKFFSCFTRLILHIAYILLYHAHKEIRYFHKKSSKINNSF